MRRLLFAVIPIAALAIGLIAQSNDAKVAKEVPAPAGTPADDETRFKLDVTRVNLLFTVSDKKGRFVTDLIQNDFEVIEQKRPQEILEFTAESDLPLRLAILIDTSNSVRDRFRFQQEAAIEFINSVVRPEVDKAIIVSFDTGFNIAADLTGDIETLTEAVRAMRPGGGTALYDAIFGACKERLMQDQPKHKFRRALVILSDGDDNQSRYSRDQALELAHRADAVMYTISTNITRVQTDGDKVLKYFAYETGGLPFFPFKAEDLAQSFENIANELRHQYNILYRPDPLKTDGKYHEVDIKVKTQKNLVVRARKGYYAPVM